MPASTPEDLSPSNTEVLQTPNQEGTTSSMPDILPPKITEIPSSLIPETSSDSSSNTSNPTLVKKVSFDTIIATIALVISVATLFYTIVSYNIAKTAFYISENDKRQDSMIFDLRAQISIQTNTLSTLNKQLVQLNAQNEKLNLVYYGISDELKMEVNDFQLRMQSDSNKFIFQKLEFYRFNDSLEANILNYRYNSNIANNHRKLTTWLNYMRLLLESQMSNIYLNTKTPFKEAYTEYYYCILGLGRAFVYEPMGRKIDGTVFFKLRETTEVFSRSTTAINDKDNKRIKLYIAEMKKKCSDNYEGEVADTSELHRR